MEGSLRTWVVLQDAAGQRTTLSLPTMTLDDARTDVVLRVPTTTGLSLVSVLARGTPSLTATPPDGSVR